MTPTRFTLLDALTGAAVVGGLAVAAWIGLEGPTGPIPVHFGLDGQPDRWGDRNEVALTLGGLTLLLGAVAALCGAYAKQAADRGRRQGLIAGQAVTTLTMVISGAMIAGLALSGATPPPAVHMAGLSLLFACIGAFLGRVGPNAGVGLRTPWTFKSRLAWDRSNRLAGRLFFLIGLAGLAAAPFAPQPLGLQAVLAAVVLAAVWSVVESWRVWRTDPDRQPF